MPNKRRLWPWAVGGVVLLLIAIGSIAKPAAPAATTSNPATGIATPAVVPTLDAASVPAPPAVPPAIPADANAPAAGTAPSRTMPNPVGRNLQDAQDAIQARNAIFFTKSHDATGRGRHQILDQDWKVCSQNVKPGATITTNTVIDFGAAKLGEDC